MPKHFRVPRGLTRILAPGLLLAFVVLGSADSLFGQVVTGFDLAKSCPSAPVNAGTSFVCTYTLTNQGTNGVVNLAVTNQAPFPAGPIVPIDCLQAGSPVATLGPNGSATDTCIGSAQETAPACGAANAFFVDQIGVSGNDAVTGTPVTASTTNSVTVLACTPTPTNTPIDTPTNTPTNTPIDTPTTTPTNTPMEGPPPPPVPTLSFPMMVLLGLLLAGTGLFLARRQ